MTRQFNKTLNETKRASAAQFLTIRRPAPPMETTGMHARLSPSIRANRKKNANVVVRRTQCSENVLLSFGSYDVPYEMKLR